MVDIVVLEKNSAANTIQRASEHLKLDISEVAEVLGVHRQTVFRIRKMESVPTADVQERLAKFREISTLLSEVFYGSSSTSGVAFQPRSAAQGPFHGPDPQRGI